jgi:hypothetical protein
MDLQIETYHILTHFDMQICCYGLFLIQSAGKADRHCIKWNWTCESVDKELHGNGYLLMFIVAKCKGGKYYLDWYSLLFILFECPMITILNIHNEEKAGGVYIVRMSFTAMLFIYLLFILSYLQPTLKLFVTFLLPFGRNVWHSLRTHNCRFPPHSSPIIIHETVNTRLKNIR